MITTFIDMFMHLDKHLDLIIREYGMWTHAILFLIIFCETGLVITPLLPGDSLLFAVGTFAALGSLDVKLLTISLSIGGYCRRHGELLDRVLCRPEGVQQGEVTIL